MGRSRYKIVNPDAPHFLTCTIINWIDLFTHQPAVQIILNSLTYLQAERGLKLYGYVIMENHLHWIAQAEDLPKEIASFRSFTAKMLVRHFETISANEILDQLARFKKPHKTDRRYQVWEEGVHPQQIQGNDMMRQKLEYIHHNPVKRGYVDNPLHWCYSSAKNYQGQQGLIEVNTDWS